MATVKRRCGHGKKVKQSFQSEHKNSHRGNHAQVMNQEQITSLWRWLKTCMDSVWLAASPMLCSVDLQRQLREPTGVMQLATCDDHIRAEIYHDLVRHRVFQYRLARQRKCCDDCEC